MVSPRAQKGAILISVLAALAIMAAIVQLLELQQGMLANNIARQYAVAVANGVAEAGLRDALLQARKGGFYPSRIIGTLPGHGTYEAEIVKDVLNPSIITITSRADMSSMAQVKLQRTYALACPNGTITTLIGAYIEAPTNITENYLSTLQKGYLHPRDNANDRSRILISFNLGSTPPSGANIDSATLMLDLQQHDPAMEGATLYVNRLLQKWSAKNAEWRYADGKTAWKSADGRGGYYTPVGEARASISKDTFVYRFDIREMMQEWLKGTSNYGLILRTDGITTGGPLEFRLKKNTGTWPGTQWPRIEVKWC